MAGASASARLGRQVVYGPEAAVNGRFWHTLYALALNTSGERVFYMADVQRLARISKATAYRHWAALWDVVYYGCWPVPMGALRTDGGALYMDGVRFEPCTHVGRKAIRVSVNNKYAGRWPSEKRRRAKARRRLVCSIG